MSDNEDRYIGKVRQQTFEKKDGSGSFNKVSIVIDNPNPVTKENAPNTYHKGVLLWIDAETGSTYQVKQIDLAGVSEGDAGRGYINSLKLQLGNTYSVTKLK